MFNGDIVSVLEKEKFLEIGCRTKNILNATTLLNCVLKKKSLAW